MIYECEKCEADLSPGLWACPQCGDLFDEPVPDNADFLPPATPHYEIAHSVPEGSLFFLNTPRLDAKQPFARKPARRVKIFRAAAALVLVLGIGFGANFVRQRWPNLFNAFLAQHTVTYRVTGTVTTADVTYQNGIGGSEQNSAAPLPWSQTYKVNSGTYLYLSAETGGHSGRVRTEIDVDGKPRKTAVTEGAYATIYVNDSLQ